MLLEFSCSNHKSIKDEVVFSAIASTDTTDEEKIYVINGLRVLKSAVVYGANGSGKSNFVDAISFVKHLVIGSIRHQPGESILQKPHKLEGYGKESTYRIQFITGGIRYVFGFTLKNMLVTDEYMYYFPRGRQAKIFERSAESFEAGNQFRGKFNACKDVLKPNRLFLSCAANFSTAPEVIAAYKFFSDELVIYEPAHAEHWMNYSLYQMNENPNMKKAVVALMQELDMGVKDIVVTIDKKQLESSELPPFLSDEFKHILLREKIDAISAKVVYGTFETDLIQEESTGVQKLFEMLCPLIDIMVNGKVLVCDEIESNLHESLVFGLVKLFVSHYSEGFSQLFFTTHETGLLNLDLFRRDQIWFTELRIEDRSTDLYSLAEIKNVRKEDNFERGYISGKYGAIPMLNLNFANVIAGI